MAHLDGAIAVRDYYSVPPGFSMKSWATHERQQEYVITAENGWDLSVWCCLCGKYGDADSHFSAQRHLEHVLKVDEIGQTRAQKPAQWVPLCKIKLCPEHFMWSQNPEQAWKRHCGMLRDQGLEP